MRKGDLANAFGSLEGAEIPGGCDFCDAVQTVEPVKAGIWLPTVHHDPRCPTLKAQR